MNALNESIHNLTTFLKDAHIHQKQATTTLDDLISSPTDRLAEQRISPGIARPEGRRLWPRRSTVSAQRPTA